MADVSEGTELTGEQYEFTPSTYGPKRVKTKQMEIEQFDPRVVNDADAKASASLPGFCSSHICIAVPKRYEDREATKYRYP